MKPELMPTSPLRDQADALLRRIAADTGALAELQGKLAEAVRLVSEVFTADIEARQLSLSSDEAMLRQLALDHLDDFFPEIQEDKDGNNLRRDQANLPSGTLQLKITVRIKQARSVLKKLLDLGLSGENFLKRTVSVNWDSLKDQSDADLVELGTERITETDIAFQLPETAGNKSATKTTPKGKKKAE